MKKRPGCSLQPGRFCSDGVTPNSVYYKNCAEAHADGRYDIPAGDPAYRPELDKDHNGIAYESRKPGSAASKPAS